MKHCMVTQGKEDEMVPTIRFTNPGHIYQQLVELAYEHEWLPADRSTLLGQYEAYTTARMLPIEVMVSMSGFYAVLLDAVPDGETDVLFHWTETYFNDVVRLPFGLGDALEAAYVYLTQDWSQVLLQEKNGWQALLDFLEARIAAHRLARSAA